MKRMDYNDLLESESRAKGYANVYLKGFADKGPVIIDTLLQLNYFTGKGEDIKTVEGEFHSFCFHQYIQIPYSLRAVFILYNLGYFHEATFIIRHLFERLAKMKYLINHKDQTSTVWINKPTIILDKKGKKKRLTIKDIFEEVSPGFYDINYGKLLSGILHGGGASIMFRVEGKNNEERSIKMGSIWDEKTATYIVNNFIAVSFYFLYNFPKFFPNGFSDLESDLLFQYIGIIDWLKGGMDDHKRKNLKSVDWYKTMEGFF